MPAASFHWSKKCRAIGHGPSHLSAAQAQHGPRQLLHLAASFARFSVDGGCQVTGYAPRAIAGNIVCAPICGSRPASFSHRILSAAAACYRINHGDWRAKHLATSHQMAGDQAHYCTREPAKCSASHLLHHRATRCSTAQCAAPCQAAIRNPCRRPCWAARSGCWV